MTDLGSPEGVAIDHLSRTVFWTDSLKDRIEVASLDGLQRRIIVDSDLVNPRAIITDPFSGCVFKLTSGLKMYTFAFVYLLFIYSDITVLL